MDGAWNLPWSGLTLAHFCFNPPGAFYFGRRWLKYDRPVFLEVLDLDSYQKWPAWLDGFKASVTCTRERRGENKVILLVRSHPLQLNLQA